MTPARTHDMKRPPTRPPRALIVIVPIISALAVAFLALLPLLLIDLERPVPNGGPSLTQVLLFVIIVLLAVIILLLLAKLLCGCGCNDRGGKSLFGLFFHALAALLPGLGGKLRMIARAFQTSAEVARTFKDPLHDRGNEMRQLGASLVGFEIPKVEAQTMSFWQALREAMLAAPGHVDIGEQPDNFPNFRVMRSFSINRQWKPFAAEGSLGWLLTLAGENTYAAGTYAQQLEIDFTNAAGVVNSVADVVEVAQL